MEGKLLKVTIGVFTYCLMSGAAQAASMEKEHGIAQNLVMSESSPSPCPASASSAPLSMAQIAPEEQEKKISWAAGVDRIDDDLYVSKVNDACYVAMERIRNPEQLKAWMLYGQRQYAMNLSAPEGARLQSMEGIGRFKSVLEEYQCGRIPSTHELWITYASNWRVTSYAKPITSHATAKVAIACDPGIDMCMTVVTSPEACVTSHMGITRSVEAHQDLIAIPPRRYKQSNLSMYLHKIAAQVMLMRGPHKRYMLTVPVMIMAQIFCKHLPQGSVFVGDTLYEQNLRRDYSSSEVVQRVKATLSAELAGDDAENRRKRRKVMAQEHPYECDVPQKFDWLTTHPPRIQRVKGKPRAADVFTLQAPAGEPLVEFTRQDADYQWLSTPSYCDQGVMYPYVLATLKNLAAFGRPAE